VKRKGGEISREITSKVKGRRLVAGTPDAGQEYIIISHRRTGGRSGRKFPQPKKRGEGGPKKERGRSILEFNTRIGEGKGVI